jgi:CheY-like chemotaxis protein
MTRVLVVDDEIDTLNLLRTILEISGYQAFTTLNSVEAIMLAEMEHPDCILLDIMMPQLDGFTLCKMMRLHPATMNLPIIFVTAYSALDIEERRLEAGADMVLPKPIGMDALIEAVETATELRASKAAELKPMPDFLSATPISTPPVVQTAPGPNGQPTPLSNIGAKTEGQPKAAVPADAKPEAKPAEVPPSSVSAVSPVRSVADTAKTEAKTPDEAKPATAPASLQPPPPPKVETAVDGAKPGLKTVVKPLDDLPIDIGISPDPAEEPAKEAPAAGIPPAAKETT